MDDNTSRAVVWPTPVPGKKGVYTDIVELGMLTPGSGGVATDINDDRIVVGYVVDTRAGGSGEYVAVTWERQARWKYNPTVLAMPAGALTSSAQAISEVVDGQAQIAGIATAAAGKRAGVWE